MNRNKAPAECDFPLVSFDDWTKGRSIGSVGTNHGAAVLPFQAWRRFKESFAPELIQRATLETQMELRRLPEGIIDPFGGSGTTALAAQFLGIKPSTIEVNPFLADLIECKICSYDLATTSRCFGQVVSMVNSAKPADDPFPGAPATFVEPGVKGRYLFSRSVAERIAAFRDAINSLSDESSRRLFIVILGSVVIPCSNVTISGKGRRYRRGSFNNNVPATLVDKLFCEGVLAALYDIERYMERKCRSYTLLRGDARTLLRTMPHSDLAVFSPPYPNSFDYTDVYNVELWTLGYIKDKVENRRLRESTLRSHVQILRDMTSENSSSPELTRSLEKLFAVRAQLWNRHIPEMIGAYFSDMRSILYSLRQNIRTGGRIYMVVGDSRYGQIDVPVGAILREESVSMGFGVVKSEPFRSMRASPQQGGRHELAETLLVLSA